MKADLTRNTDHAYKHFSRVLMQQGRVQLDADWNEQACILLRTLRIVAADLIGPAGGPVARWGFQISPITDQLVSGDFRIGFGRYYVDGILCEAESEAIGYKLESANNQSTLIVDQWTLNGTPFAPGQLVEIFDDARVSDAPQFVPILCKITGVEGPRLTLALQPGGSIPSTPATFPSNPRLRRVITYLTQPDYPVPNAEKLTVSSGSKKPNYYFVFLDVWERLITYAEDDAIREIALGGPDTAARSKVIWQVKAVPGSLHDGALATTPSHVHLPNKQIFSYADSTIVQKTLGAHRGLLRARAKQTSNSTDPCIMAPNASYSGPENQLYRVEVHRAGYASAGNSASATGNNEQSATFKWSRDNGSVIFPIVSLTSGSGQATVVTLETLGRDNRLELAEGQCVELQDDAVVLQNQPGALMQIQSIDRTAMTVTLAGVRGSNVGQDSSQHPLLRRWDYQAGDPSEGGLQLASDNAAFIIESDSAWFELEDGVQIQFCAASGTDATNANYYHTGDYWLIPARVATSDVEWPVESRTDSNGNAITVPLAQAPDGVQHHYSPVAVVGSDGTVIDCRKKFSACAL